jgi:lambda family phage tail tape measure protein
LDRLSEKMAAYSTETGKAGGAMDQLSEKARSLEIGLARLAASWTNIKIGVTGLFNGSGVEEFWRAVRKVNEELDATEREINATPRLRSFAEIAKSMSEVAKKAAPVQGQMQRLREEFNYQFSDPFAGVATKMGLLNDAFKRGVVPLMEYKTMLRQLQVEDMAELRAAAKATLEDTLADGAVNAAEKMRALEQAVRAGTITFGEFGAKAKSVSREAMQGVQSALDSVSSSMESAFSQFTESGKVNFKEMTRSILADLARLALRMMVLKPLFGGGDSAGLIGSLFKGVTRPGFANGGRPAVGMPSWVGERGKELFVPDSPGTIIPNHMLGNGASSGGQIVVRLEHSDDFNARVDTRMSNVVAQRAPAIVGASVDATRRSLPSMLGQAQRRSL